MTQRQLKNGGACRLHSLDLRRTSHRFRVECMAFGVCIPFSIFWYQVGEELVKSRRVKDSDGEQVGGEGEGVDTDTQ